MTQTNAVHFSCIFVCNFVLNYFFRLICFPGCQGSEGYRGGSLCRRWSEDGYRRIEALALGARAVFVGRPIIWGLAHDVSVFFNIRVKGLKTEW